MRESEIPTADIKAMGRRVKWARELVYPNRSEFARRMELDVTTIRKFEDGQRGVRLVVLDRIIHSLRLTYDYVRNGSLSGIDGELAAKLVARHPELMPPLAPAPGRTGKAAPDSTSRTPKTPGTHSLFL